MNKPFMVSSLAHFIKARFGIEPDLVDLNALVDSSLSYSENKRIVIQSIGKKHPNPELSKRVIAELEAQSRQEALESFVEQNEPPDFQRTLRTYTDMILESDIDLLSVRSEGGLGKTHTILSRLDSLGFKAGREYAYITGYITPMQFFIELREFQHQLVVLDDLEGLLSVKKNLAMLKSACFPSLYGQRVVQYHSTQLKMSSSWFVSNSKFILLFNTEPKNADFKAVISRGIYYNMEPSNAEIYSAMRRKKDTDPEVIDYLENALKHHNPVNFRHYEQVAAMKKAHSESWKELSLPLIGQEQNPFLELEKAKRKEEGVKK